MSIAWKIRPRRVVLVLVALLVTGGGVSLFMLDGKASPAAKKGAAPEAAREEVSVPVEVEPPARGPVSAALGASSTLESEQQAEVLSKVDGLVTRVFVDEGALVSKGQVLADVDDREKQLALEQARMKLEGARRELQRADQSHKESLISEAEFEKAKNAFELAGSEVASAELSLTYTKIRAPFGGRIVEKAVVQGRHIKPGEKLFTLASLAPLVARVYLPEREVTGLRLGQPAEIVLEASGARRLAARVSKISPVVDVNTGTVKVTVEVVRPDADARPGSYARVAIVTDVHEGALLVRKIAIVREEQNDYVYVAESGRARRRRVALGYASDGHIEVTSGLTGGEAVIVAGQGGLKEGAKIEIVQRKTG